MNGPAVIKNDYLGIYVNCFVLETERYNIFIDSGLRRAGGQLAPWLRNGKEPVLLCTHGHWDHIGMHGEIRRAGGTLWAHPGDRRYYEDFDWHWQVLFGQFAGDFALPPARRETFWADIGDPVSPGGSLEEGQILRFDELEFAVLHTPGHSAGSVCFHERSRSLLFTGDSLMGDGFFAGVPQYCDPAAYRHSMERLAALAPAWVFSCHNEPLPGERLAEKAREGIHCSLRLERALENYLRDHRGAGRVTLGEAAAAMCRPEGKAVGGGACVTALAHLALLGGEYSAARACARDYSESTLK